MMKIAERMNKVSPSATLKLTSRAKEMKARGLPVISFGAGEPDFDTPQAVKDEAVKQLAAGFTKYTPSSGIPELKEAVCRKFQEDQQLSYTPEQVIVSCGAKHSLYNLIQVLCGPEDEILIPAPYWVSYPEMAYLAGATPVFIDCPQSEGFRLTAERLKKALTPRSKALILNSPSNPTGAVLDEKDLRAIAEIVLELGRHRRTARPGLDGLTFALLLHRDHFFHQFLVHKWTLTDGSAHPTTSFVLRTNARRALRRRLSTILNCLIILLPLPTLPPQNEVVRSSPTRSPGYDIFGTMFLPAACFQTLGQNSRARGRLTSAGRFAFATTHRMVHRILSHGTGRRTTAQPAIPTGLA